MFWLKLVLLSKKQESSDPRVQYLYPCLPICIPTYCPTLPPTSNGIYYLMYHGLELLHTAIPSRQLSYFRIRAFVMIVNHLGAVYTQYMSYLLTNIVTFFVIWTQYYCGFFYRNDSTLIDRYQIVNLVTFVFALCGICSEITNLIKLNREIFPSRCKLKYSRFPNRRLV